MLVYRIARQKYANDLHASGYGARWNKAEQFVIYTASSRSLAALEVLVNTSKAMLLQQYHVMEIELEITNKHIETIKLSTLPKDWQQLGNYQMLKNLGSEWYLKNKKLALKVPSAIVPQEFNFVINSKHKDFNDKVSLRHSTPFIWDNRLV